MLLHYREPLSARLRTNDGHLVDVGLGLAAVLCVCALLSWPLLPVLSLPAVLLPGAMPVTAICFLAMILALTAMRRNQPRIATAFLLAVPTLCTLSLLLARRLPFSPTSSLPWFSPPHLACFIILLALSLAILLSLPQTPLLSRAAVLISCMVTGVGLATLLGLRLAEESVLLTYMGGMLATLVGGAIIAINHEIGRRTLLGTPHAEKRALRLIFLLILVSPVVLGTLGFRLNAMDGIRPELIAMGAICLHILLGISLLFWIWDRIGRGTAARRALTRALDAAPIAITDRDGRILYWSKGCETLYGWSAAAAYGQRKQIFLAPAAPSERSILPPDGNDIQEIELTERCRDGRIVHVREQARLLGSEPNGTPLVALVMTDVTDRHAAQLRQEELREELIHASRLSGIGEAAAGLAHELGQPLAATANFLGFAELLLEKMTPGDERLHATLMLASEQALRAGEIVQRYQAFLTKRPSQMRAEPVEDTIRGAIGLATMGMEAQSATVEFHSDSRHTLMLADRVQIQQVLLNLIRNAMEAQVSLMAGASYIGIVAQDQGEDMIRISVRDHGPGIADEVLRASYRPFTSTKEDGMGLGLSICRRIVEGHGGTIHAENAPDGGALIWFTIPVASHAEAMA